MAGKIYFLVLESDNKNRLVCDLTDKIYSENKKLVFHVANPTVAKEFDQKLWIWKQSSFIPHIYVEKLDQSYEEPVVITSQIEDSTGYDTVLMYDPIPQDKLSQFDTVIDFAEKYDQAALQRSRQRYLKYQENKWPTETVKPGQFLLVNL
jgi:DNA polymerase-3 subunit chi